MFRFLLTLVLLASLMLGLAARAEKGTLVIEQNTGPFIGANNEFGLELYNKIRSRPGNVSLSPASVSTALGMTYEGARGETAREMARVLHLDANREVVRTGFQALLFRLNGDGSPRPYRLSVTNSLWGQRGKAFLGDFLTVASKTYGAGLESVDFQGDPEGAAREINAWVNTKTNKMIPTLLQPGDLSARTTLVLVNTIYLKAGWLNPFEVRSTRPADFHVTSTRIVPVPMMRQSRTFRHQENDVAQVLEMPYQGGDLAMVVLLPKTVDGISALETAMTPARLDEWLGKLQSGPVIVELPRFKVTTSTELSEALTALGMPSAFDRKSDFSGIDGTHELYLSKVIHQVVVDVNEEGTEAAAATAPVMKSRTASPVRPVVFRADHPFVYLIRDLRTGAILFLGRFSSP